MFWYLIKTLSIPVEKSYFLVLTWFEPYYNSYALSDFACKCILLKLSQMFSFWYIVAKLELRRGSLWAMLFRLWFIVFGESEMHEDMVSSQRMRLKISKFVDKLIRLKLLTVKGMGKEYLEKGLSAWFGTRITWGKEVSLFMFWVIEKVVSLFVFALLVHCTYKNSSTWCNKVFDWIKFYIHIQKKKKTKLEWICTETPN